MPDTPLPMLPAAATTPPAAPGAALPVIAITPPAAPAAGLPLAASAPPTVPSAGLPPAAAPADAPLSMLGGDATLPIWPTPPPGSGTLAGVVRYDAVESLLSSNVFVAPTIISGPGALYFASPGQTAGQAALLYPQVPVAVTNSTTFHHGEMWAPLGLQVLSQGLYQVTLGLSNPVFASYESHQLWVTPTAAAIDLLSATFYAAIDPGSGYLLFASSAPEDYSTPQECVFTLNVPSGSTGSAWIGGSLPTSADSLDMSVTVTRLI